MSRLDRTVSNLTTPDVYKREASASPGRRQVSFDDERTMPLAEQRSKTLPPKQELYHKTQHHRISRFEQGGFSGKRPNFRRPSLLGPIFTQPTDVRRTRQQRFIPPTEPCDQNACRRCGRKGGHENPLYCPILNEKCWCRDKIGHSYRVRRKSRESTASQF
jgi:hypothetical protein